MGMRDPRNLVFWMVRVIAWSQRHHLNPLLAQRLAP